MPPSPAINLQSLACNHLTKHITTSYTMVCSKCQKKMGSSTMLATPGVKKKNDMYYGSPASSASKDKASATLGNNGIGKVSLSCVLIVPGR